MNLRLSDWIGISAVCAAFLQFVVLLFTLLGLNRTARRQLRAYVLVESGAIANIIEPEPPNQRVNPTNPTQILAHVTRQDLPANVFLTIKNTGQTPAMEVTHWGNAVVREYPLTTQLPGADPDIKPMPSVLGPGIQSTKRLVLPAPLSVPQITEIRGGTMAVYVYGQIKYRDIFKKTWTTEYRTMYYVYGGVLGINTALTFCEEGNKAK